MQHVTEPIRGRNILDLVMSKPDQLIEEVKITLPLETSDHDTVEFIVPVRTNEDNWKIEYLNYRKANFKAVSILGFENCQSFFRTTAHVRTVCRYARRTQCAAHAMRGAHQFD